MKKYKKKSSSYLTVHLKNHHLLYTNILTDSSTLSICNLPQLFKNFPWPASVNGWNLPFSFGTAILVEFSSLCLGDAIISTFAQTRPWLLDMLLNNMSIWLYVSKVHIARGLNEETPGRCRYSDRVGRGRNSWSGFHFEALYCSHHQRKKLFSNENERSFAAQWSSIIDTIDTAYKTNSFV